MIDKNITGLELIQGIINRMGANSFNLKGWAVTLVSGIFALASNDANKIFFLVAYIPIILFWFLDSYYLQLEKKYRQLYNKVRLMNKEEFDYNLDISQINNKEIAYGSCLLSLTEVGFYLPLALITALIIIII